MAEFRKRGSFFRIASVYAPNRNPERDKFFTSCLDFADRSVPTILCGDFNAVFDRAKDSRGSDPAVTVRESFVSLGLLGCLAPSPSGSSRLHLAKARWSMVPSPPPIDFIGFLSTWLYLVSSCSIVQYPFSDHDAVFFKLFEASGLDRGRVSPLFHFFRIGRTEARNISNVLRSAIVVVLIINVLCRALSFLPLFAI